MNLNKTKVKKFALKKSQVTINEDLIIFNYTNREIWPLQVLWSINKKGFFKILCLVQLCNTYSLTAMTMHIQVITKHTSLMNKFSSLMNLDFRKRVTWSKLDEVETPNVETYKMRENYTGMTIKLLVFMLCD